MLIKDKLNKLNLNIDNSVVIGSGILQALGVRESKDIDLVISQDEYNRLKESKDFTVEINQYGKEVLTGDLFEIVTGWEVLDKDYKFNDLKENSVVIDDVRYITLDFLYQIKDSWLKKGKARPKDLVDLKLIENYRRS